MALFIWNNSVLGILLHGGVYERKEALFRRCAVGRDVLYLRLAGTRVYVAVPMCLLRGAHHYIVTALKNSNYCVYIINYDYIISEINYGAYIVVLRLLLVGVR